MKQYEKIWVPSDSPVPANSRTIDGAFFTPARGLVVLSLEEVREAANEAAKANEGYELRRIREEIKELRKEIETFELSSGIKISDGWRASPKKIGEAVRFLTSGGGVSDVFNKLQNLHQQFNSVHAAMTHGMECISPLLEEHNKQKKVFENDNA